MAGECRNLDTGFMRDLFRCDLVWRIRSKNAQACRKQRGAYGDSLVIVRRDFH